MLIQSRGCSLDDADATIICLAVLQRALKVETACTSSKCVSHKSGGGGVMATLSAAEPSHPHTHTHTHFTGDSEAGVGKCLEPKKSLGVCQRRFA